MVRPVRHAVAIALLAAGPAAAQIVAQPPSAASVTIYRDQDLSTTDLDRLDPSQGLALITETRVVDAPAAGRMRIAFRGVADTMVPETAALEGLPGLVLERNEDFDLLTPGSLVAHSLGRTVRVVQTGPGKGQVSERTAVLRSGPNGVLLDFGGKLEALGCGGPPTRLVFDRVPPALSDKPTFSVLAQLPKAGRYTVKLSYLATGFTWSADYVARIRPDGRTLDLAGWLTLANKSSAGFARAPTQVVAGQLERDASTRPPQPKAEAIAPACWGQSRVVYAGAPLAVPPIEHRLAEPNAIQELVVTAGRKLAVQSELGDYKLYTLPEPTTVAARQTKQVAFLDQPAVPFERVYVYRLGPDTPDPEQTEVRPDVVLRLQNRPQFGLGKPLPSGTVAVMEPGAGGLVLAGEQAVRDTAVGLPIELDIGRALDVTVAPRVTGREMRDGQQSVAISVAFADDKPEPVTVEFHQAPVGTGFTLAEASQPAVMKAGDQVWTLRLRPGGRAQLSYTIRFRN